MELFPTKRPNFCRISHSLKFPPKRPNFRRISHSGRFRRNGRMNPNEFTPNFVLGDVSDETAEFLPNFALGDVSPETAEFPPNFAVRDVSDKNAESIPPNFALGTFPTKRPNFALGDVSPDTAETMLMILSSALKVNITRQKESKTK
ncbi:MAG: hypothetical protein Q8881_04435 [Sweet potato little leaf phytoplasma]|nr:hypothetical protein [Sweet potato little leaf phytoplasma]